MAAYEYEQWHPVKGIPDILHLHSLVDNLEKICVELKSEEETKPHRSAPPANALTPSTAPA